jgi:tetratricopeptide (TPR) repeat protein
LALLALVVGGGSGCRAAGPQDHEEKLHLAIRELPASLDLPAPDGADDPAGRLARACATLEGVLKLPPGTLQKDLPAFARKLLDDKGTSAVERAGALFAIRDYAGAESAALRIPGSDPQFARALQLAGRSAAQLGQLGRALGHYRAAGALVSREQEPLQWAGVQRDIGIVLMKTGHLGEAEVIWRNILEIHLGHLKPQHRDVIGARNVLAATLSKEGKWAEAAAQYREVLAALEPSRGPDDPDVQRARRNLERATKAAAAPGNPRP